MASKVPIMLLLLVLMVAVASAATAMGRRNTQPLTAKDHPDRKLLVAATKITAKEMPVPLYSRSGRKLMSSAVVASSYVGGSTAITDAPDVKFLSKGRKLNSAAGSALNTQVINTPLAKPSDLPAAHMSYSPNNANNRKLMTSTSVSSSYKKLASGLKFETSDDGVDGRRLMVTRPTFASQASKETPAAIVGGVEVVANSRVG